jgi:hypothetical protein
MVDHRCIIKEPGVIKEESGLFSFSTTLFLEGGRSKEAYDWRCLCGFIGKKTVLRCPRKKERRFTPVTTTIW